MHDGFKNLYITFVSKEKKVLVGEISIGTEIENFCKNILLKRQGLCLNVVTSK